MTSGLFHSVEIKRAVSGSECQLSNCCVFQVQQPQCPGGCRRRLQHGHEVLRSKGVSSTPPGTLQTGLRKTGQRPQKHVTIKFGSYEFLSVSVIYAI